MSVVRAYMLVASVIFPLAAPFWQSSGRLLMTFESFFWCFGVFLLVDIYSTIFLLCACLRARELAQLPLFLKISA